MEISLATNVCNWSEQSGNEFWETKLRQSIFFTQGDECHFYGTTKLNGLESFFFV